MKTSIMPVRRNLEFHLPAERIADWHPAGVHVSHFFNALSIFFPAGERFFIDSVRHYRDRIQDPELNEAVRGFIGQEAMHSREHEEYNEALTARGLRADRYEAVVVKQLQRARRLLSPRRQLATTIALEHLTAILANRVLVDPRVLEGAEPRYAAVWHWHALEETEHKAVAFDVYRQVAGKGLMAYLHRCLALLIATTMFWAMVIPFHIGLVRGEGQGLNFRGWGRVMNFLWGSPGTLRKSMLDWLDYFRPGFHPWDHDNRQYLGDMDSLVDEVSSYASAEKSAA